MPKQRHSQCVGDIEGLEDPGFESQQEQYIFFLLESCRPSFGLPHLPASWVIGALSPGAKWAGFEDDLYLASTLRIVKLCLCIPICLRGL